MTGSDFWSLRDCGSRAAGAWHDFFHRPCDTRVCAAIRILFASLVLVYFAVLYPDLNHWFTADGVLPAESSREVASPYHWSILWLLPDTPQAVRICFWIAVVQTVLLWVGLLPRLQALCIFLWLVSFQVRNTQITDGEDDVFKMIAFCLIWMPSGHCWSLDARLRQWWGRTNEPRRSGISTYDALPGWGLRLLQIEMAFVFLSAGLSKLAGEWWLNGTALYYVARLDDFFGRFPIPNWPFDTPWVVALLTWSVPLIEIAAPLFIWFRETRRICLVIVLLFHLANEWTMHLFLFHWIMLCGWLAFVTADDFRWLSWFPLPVGEGGKRSEPGEG